MEENVGYINEEVRKMYGIPYNKLTAEQKRILHADSVKRAKLISRVEKDTMDNGATAFKDEAEMEKILADLYSGCMDRIISAIVKVMAKVKKSGGTWSYANMSELTRQRGLFEQIAKILKELTGKEKTLVYDYLSHIYTDQFMREIYSLGQYMPVNANFNRLNPALVKQTIEYPWSGSMFSDRLWLDKERLLQSLRTNLTQSMILGESIVEVTERMQKALDTSRYNAERVVRTETKRVCYIAHVEAFKENGVKQVKYRCANGGDERTCKTCKADEGKIYELGKEPTLPRHPNCRCVYIPVVSDTFKPNELNELTGSIRGAENYNKWVEHYKEILNPDGSLKDGWRTEWGKAVKDKYGVPVKTLYTTADGKKLTLEEYKKQFGMK